MLWRCAVLRSFNALLGQSCNFGAFQRVLRRVDYYRILKDFWLESQNLTPVECGSRQPTIALVVIENTQSQPWFFNPLFAVWEEGPALKCRVNLDAIQCRLCPNLPDKDLIGEWREHATSPPRPTPRTTSQDPSVSLSQRVPCNTAAPLKKVKSRLVPVQKQPATPDSRDPINLRTSPRLISPRRHHCRFSSTTIRTSRSVAVGLAIHSFYPVQHCRVRRQLFSACLS